MDSFPSTKRFFIIKDPNRRNIEDKPSDVMEVMYYSDSGDKPAHFANIWQIKGWGEEYEGKWTINRGGIPIKNNWWPKEYFHDTLEELVNHLEETFKEGVPCGPHSSK